MLGLTEPHVENLVKTRCKRGGQPAPRRATNRKSLRGQHNTASPLLYEYADSSPVSSRDPTGMLVELCWRPLEGGFPRSLFDHAYIRVTGASGPPRHYGYFESNGGTMSPSQADNEGEERPDANLRTG